MIREILKLLGIAAGLFALYYVLPLDRLAGGALGLTLTCGILVLGAVSTWQIKKVIDSEHPAIRAIESLAGIVPLFLILFASAYYVVASSDPDSFTENLTRTDALYFALTVLTTVGFGDITAVTQMARVVVMVQMGLGLILLGLGVRVLTQAVRLGMAHRQPDEQGQGQGQGQD